MSRSVFSWGLLWALVASGSLRAQDPKSIEDRFQEMQDRYEQRIAALEREVRDLRSHADHGAHEPAGAIDCAIHDLASHGCCSHGHEAFRLAGAPERALEVSMALLFAAGTSTERDASLQTLQGGAHDPRKRGFTFQQAELSLIGTVDSCFLAEADIVFQIDPIEGETEVEVEESFITTTSMPYHLNAKLGYTFTEFGILNPQHPERWAFLDQPVIHTRVFSGEGMRQLGARLQWNPRLPWCCEILGSVQNPNGGTMISFFANDEVFEERAIGGRPFVENDVRNLGDLVYNFRVANSFAIGREFDVRFGASTAFGPNATGPDGWTWIYGGDLIVAWNPSGCEGRTPLLFWQSEFIFRDYHADEFFSEEDPLDPLDDVFLPDETLHDWGFYTQLLFGFAPRWLAGVRYEHAASSGEDVDPMTGAPVSTADDPYRDDRHRLSALIGYRPSEFTRIRLQYNFDRAQHLSDDAHSIWLGVEFVFGHHAKHQH
jgi:hypothetical protein